MHGHLWMATVTTGIAFAQFLLVEKGLETLGWWDLNLWNRWETQFIKDPKSLKSPEVQFAHAWIRMNQMLHRPVLMVCEYSTTWINMYVQDHSEMSRLSELLIAWIVLISLSPVLPRCPELLIKQSIWLTLNGQPANIPLQPPNFINTGLQASSGLKQTSCLL